MPSPAASVVVVCHNEEKNIAQCLGAILAQDFTEDWELIVIDNRSTDRTADLAAAAAKDNPRIRVVPNDVRTLSVGRNLGWQSARAPLVAYTDADCIVPPHWLRTLVEAFRTQKRSDPFLAGVGGGNYQPNDTPFYHALNIFLKSPFGNRGSTQTEKFGEGRYVDSLASLNVLYEKTALESVAGYDSAGFPRVGEDEDLNSRLAASGKRLFFVPKCEVLHYWRNTLGGWCRNMYLYGFGRVKLRRRHPERARMTDLLCLAVPGAIVLAAFSWVCWLLAIPLAFYLVVIATASLVGCLKAKSLGSIPRVFAFFVGTHLYYGLGFLRGMVFNTP